jgi:co-chaperonin GroES (HSP10)
MKEQSSILKPKNDLIGLKKTDSQKLPKPTGWRLLVLPFKQKEKTKGGIILARYAGSRIKIDGGEIRLLNDDEVLATVDNPEDIFHEF